MVVYALALIALALAFAQPERTVAVPDGRAAVVLATDRSSVHARDRRAPQPHHRRASCRQGLPRTTCRAR